MDKDRRPVGEKGLWHRVGMAGVSNDGEINARHVMYIVLFVLQTIDQMHEGLSPRTRTRRLYMQWRVRVLPEQLRCLLYAVASTKTKTRCRIERGAKQMST
jgi:hypothetical protein